MKHRKGQNVGDVVAALTVAALVSAGMSVMLEGRALAEAHQKTKRPACAGEDMTAPGGVLPCLWDARHSGNGEGQSYLMRESGRIVYVSHRRAHQ